MEQIAQEGAIQIFREVGGGMEEVVVGVVGVLQLEVLEYRLNTEYNVEIRMQHLPFEQIRWILNDPDTYTLRELDLTSDTKPWRICAATACCCSPRTGPSAGRWTTTTS